MAFKRFRVDGEEIEPESRSRGDIIGGNDDQEKTFACKTCGRRFSSFQALGGHRASHRRPQNSAVNDKAAKLHLCSVCGQEFSIGQALGGHMRRHRPSAETNVTSLLQTMGKMEHQRSACFDLNLSPRENEKMKSREFIFAIVR